MAWYAKNPSVANTLNKFHIQSNFYTVYRENLYNDKQDKFDEVFGQCYLPYWSSRIDSIMEKNIDAADYEKWFSF